MWHSPHLGPPGAPFSGRSSVRAPGTRGATRTSGCGRVHPVRSAGQGARRVAAVAAGRHPGGAAVKEFDTLERGALRESCRAFVAREIVPNLAQWERDGEIPRELHKRAAEVGVLAVGAPEKVGGSGGDIIDGTIVTEAFIEAGA